MHVSKQIYYLGVEGGATKSTALLVNEKGRKVGSRIGKALNYHNLGKKAVEENLAALIGPLVKKSKGKKLYAVLGLAGMNTRKDQLIYIKMTQSLLPRNSVSKVVEDAKIALEAKCPNDMDRILVIAGTGSNIYGESGKKRAKTNGWSFILGDEGSAYDVGLKVLKAATQSWDERGQKTILETLVLELMKVKTMEDMIPKLYGTIDKGKEMKYLVASFAPLVDKAIRKNDVVAQQIRNETARELLKGVDTVGKRLNLRGKSFCLGLIGSQWKMQGLEGHFKREVKKLFPRVRFSDRQEPGVWGAILLAKKL